MTPPTLALDEGIALERPAAAARRIAPAALGNPAFKKEYGLRYAYVAGAMYKARLPPPTS